LACVSRCSLWTSGGQAPGSSLSAPGGSRAHALQASGVVRVAKAARAREIEVDNVLGGRAMAAKKGAETVSSSAYHLQLEEVPSYHPTMEEFANPTQYIASIRDEAEHYGLARIVPPEGWKPPWPIDGKKFTFATRVQVREPPSRSNKEKDNLPPREPVWAAGAGAVASIARTCA
jgi:hypothetical protein